jgi:hypothetical protein
MTNQRIPTKWFFKEHRIPRQLKCINEDGDCPIPTFFRIVAERWIPNYDDFMRYLVEEYGLWIECGFMESDHIDATACWNYELNLKDTKKPINPLCPYCGANLIISNQMYRM